MAGNTETTTGTGGKGREGGDELVFVALGASLALDVIVVGLSAAGFAGASARRCRPSP